MFEVLKILFIFVAIWFGFVNMAQLVRGQSIHWLQIVIMSGGITGFVYLQFLMK